jgi:hypothetical protein
MGPPYCVQKCGATKWRPAGDSQVVSQRVCASGWVPVGWPRGSQRQRNRVRSPIGVTHFGSPNGRFPSGFHQGRSPKGSPTKRCPPSGSPKWSRNVVPWGVSPKDFLPRLFANEVHKWVPQVASYWGPPRGRSRARAESRRETTTVSSRSPLGKDSASSRTLVLELRPPRDGLSIDPNHAVPLHLPRPKRCLETASISIRAPVREVIGLEPRSDLGRSQVRALPSHGTTSPSNPDPPRYRLGLNLGLSKPYDGLGVEPSPTSGRHPPRGEIRQGTASDSSRGPPRDGLGLKKSLSRDGLGFETRSATGQPRPRAVPRHGTALASSRAPPRDDLGLETSPPRDGLGFDPSAAVRRPRHWAQPCRGSNFGLESSPAARPPQPRVDSRRWTASATSQALPRNTLGLETSPYAERPRPRSESRRDGLGSEPSHAAIGPRSGPRRAAHWT